MRRIVSSERVSSAISNGGVSASEKIVSVSAATSMSPVGSFGFLCPPRSRIVPETPMQNSRRSSQACVCAAALVSGSKTTWVRPPRSRRSMKTQPP